MISFEAELVSSSPPRSVSFSFNWNKDDCTHSFLRWASHPELVRRRTSIWGLDAKRSSDTRQWSHLLRRLPHAAQPMWSISVVFRMSSGPAASKLEMHGKSNVLLSPVSNERMWRNNERFHLFILQSKQLETFDSCVFRMTSVSDGNPHQAYRVLEIYAVPCNGRLNYVEGGPKCPQRRGSSIEPCFTQWIEKFELQTCNNVIQLLRVREVFCVKCQRKTNNLSKYRLCCIFR